MGRAEFSRMEARAVLRHEIEVYKARGQLDVAKALQLTIDILEGKIPPSKVKK